MVFSSITFLFYFLPIFIACYVLTPTVIGKNVVTLLFSLVFYAWGEPRFLLILLFAIVFNYAAAIVIDRNVGSRRKWALGLAVAGNLMVLGVFKYANFVTANFAALFEPLGWNFSHTNIELPLGISFFTFHCLSYIIDVYRRRFNANRDPVDVALYISLFPQLVAGPIVRYKTVARQLDKRRQNSRPRLGGRAHLHRRPGAEGARRRRRRAAGSSGVRPGPPSYPARGLDRASRLHHPDLFRFRRLLEHGDRARNGARLHLPAQFPHALYLALDHRVLAALAHVAVVVAARLSLHPARRQSRREPQDLPQSRHVFVLCGVWHGANWTFVLWGLWHGAFLVVERLGLNGLLKRFPVWTRWLYALLAVMGGWVLFRSASLPAALDYYASLVGRNGAGDLSFDMHDALSERALATVIIGCVLAVLPRWLPRVCAAPRARGRRYGLDLRTARFFDDHCRLGRL